MNLGGAAKARELGEAVNLVALCLSRCESYAPHQMWYDNCIIISRDIFLLIIMKQLCIVNHGKQDTIG
jgi:hypothetical protein